MKLLAPALLQPDFQLSQNKTLQKQYKLSFNYFLELLLQKFFSLILQKGQQRKVFLAPKSFDVNFWLLEQFFSSIFLQF